MHIQVQDLIIYRHQTYIPDIIILPLLVVYYLLKGMFKIVIINSDISYI